jgi:hypothetical protein
MIKLSIAVLPFQNMSGDPEQEYFADGMVAEIITASRIVVRAAPVGRACRCRWRRKAGIEANCSD